MRHSARNAFAGLVVALLATTAAAEPERYVFDPNHTAPSFEIGHIGFSVQRGFFARSRGSVTLDRATGKGELSVEIDAGSVDTGLAVRDEMLRTDRFGFLDVARHPTISFKAGSFDFNGAQLSRVSGELTIKGKTRPVVLELMSFRCGPHPASKKEMCGGDARTQINKSDFGEFGGGMLGEQIRIAVQFEAYRE